jgi:hypothetical protein
VRVVRVEFVEVGEPIAGSDLGRLSGEGERSEEQEQKGEGTHGSLE